MRVGDDERMINYEWPKITRLIFIKLRIIFGWHYTIHQLFSKTAIRYTSGQRKLSATLPQVHISLPCFMTIETTFQVSSNGGVS